MWKRKNVLCFKCVFCNWIFPVLFQLAVYVAYPHKWWTCQQICTNKVAMQCRLPRQHWPRLQLEPWCPKKKKKMKTKWNVLLAPFSVSRQGMSCHTWWLTQVRQGGVLVGTRAGDQCGHRDEASRCFEAKPQWRTWLTHAPPWPRAQLVKSTRASAPNEEWQSGSAAHPPRQRHLLSEPCLFLSSRSRKKKNSPGPIQKGQQ